MSVQNFSQIAKCQFLAVLIGMQNLMIFFTFFENTSLGKIVEYWQMIILFCSSDRVASFEHSVKACIAFKEKFWVQQNQRLIFLNFKSL